MDALDKLIAFAQISGSIDVLCRFQGDWYVSHHPELQHGVVHIVTHGHAYLKVGDEPESCAVQAGDVLFFPRSARHVLSHRAQCDNPDDTPTIVNRAPFIIRERGSQADFRMFCARFGYDAQAELIQNLPEFLLLHLPPRDIDPLIALLTRESTSPSLGSRLVIDALAMVLLTLLIRTYLQQDQETTLNGALSGLRDRRLRPVIQAIIASPEDDWRVDQLVAHANLSRAQLMRLFKEHLGTSPHAFVHRMRLQKAAMLLRQRADSILSIALSTGFQSETHFGKAFKKSYGLTPGAYRRRAKGHAKAAPEPPSLLPAKSARNPARPLNQEDAPV